jgi:Class II Aldolase and Adducin N-terminal domain
MTQTAADNPLPYRPGERQIRVELAACYRLLARFGFSDLAGAHVSAKIPGTPHYLLNAYGYLFEDVTASSLLAVDLDGKVIGEAGLELNPAGTAIHGAVHRARPPVVRRDRRQSTLSWTRRSQPGRFEASRCSPFETPVWRLRSHRR